MKNKVPKLLLIFFAVLLVGVFSLGNYAFADSSQVQISLIANPSENSGNLKAYNVVLNFTGGSSEEKIDYIKAIIGFNKSEVTISDAVVSSENKLGRVIFVEKVPDANSKGRMTIEIGALTPGSGPTTDQKLVLGTVKLSSSNSNPTFDTSGSQIVNNSSKAIPVASTSTPPEGLLSSFISLIRRFLGLK